MVGGVHGGGMRCWGGACMAEGACVVWQILRDMVNERVVLILLECILVYDSLLIKHLVLRQRVTYPVVS